MSKIALSPNANGAGIFTIASPNSGTDRTLTLPDNTGTLVSTGSSAVVTPAMLSQPLTLGTVQASTSGTNIDFTGIPSWVKRITVMFNGVSTNGTSLPIVQIGYSGGVEVSGYAGTVSYNNNGSAIITTNFSSGFIFQNGGSAAFILHGTLVLTLINASTYLWAASGVIGASNGATAFFLGGTKTLTGTLDRVRITTTNGTDAFDAGSVNILYE